MRLLAVVAHPDDESFGCGSVLLHATATGCDTAVLCATRGEAGASRVDTVDLGALREAELRAAARILGVGVVRVLGHADSGTEGPPPARALVAVSLDALAAEVAAVLDELQPDVVVTLDASDGHRDHAAVRDATLLAVDGPGHRPAATYLWCLARSSMARWVAHQGQPGLELGTPDEEITTRIDVSAHIADRWAAIRAHASQASPYDDLPADLQRDFLATDRLRLVRGTDLLA